jgi:hypothetical protein
MRFGHRTSHVRLARFACGVIASFIAALAGAQAGASAAPGSDEKAGAAAPAAPTPAAARFTLQRLDHWLSGGRAYPPVTVLAPATVQYFIARGATDERMLYPTRIAQQLSSSLADWAALTYEVQRLGYGFGRRFLAPMRVNAKAGSIEAWAMVEPEVGAAIDAFLRRKAAVYGLATAVARGDRDAAERYAGLATDMAADPFVRDVFVAATLVRSVTADLHATANDATLDDLVRWRAHALATMLEAGSADNARAAFARVEPNTVGPVAEDEQIRPRRRASSSDGREPRTRTVQDCQWESGYEYRPGEAEAVPVEKFVCQSKEVEY